MNYFDQKVHINKSFLSGFKLPCDIFFQQRCLGRKFRQFIIIIGKELKFLLLTLSPDLIITQINASCFYLLYHP